MNLQNQRRAGGRLETYSEEQLLWHLEQARKVSQEAQSEMGAMDLSPPAGSVEPKEIRNQKAALRRRLAVAIETLKAYEPVVQEELRRLERNIAQLRIGLAGLFNEEPKTHLLDASARAHQERERVLELYEQLLQLIDQLQEQLQATWGKQQGMPLPGPQTGGFVPGGEGTAVPGVPDLSGLAGLGPAGTGSVPASPSFTEFSSHGPAGDTES